MIKVLLVEDHVLVRKGLKQIIEVSETTKVTGEANNSAEAIQKISKNEYDIVLMDISMPGRNGIDALKSIKKSKPELPVLMLSMYPEDQYAIRALQAGAAGYLTKDSAPEKLMHAIEWVNKGRKYISAELAEELASYLNKTINTPLYKNLSDREYETMLLLASGKKPSTIAQELSLSIKTVSTYKSRILKKLHLKNDADLSSYVHEHRLTI